MMRAARACSVCAVGVTAAAARAQRLIGIGRFGPAGDLLKDVDQPKEAIDCYIRAGAWDKARDVGAKATKFRDYAETAYARARAADARMDFPYGCGRRTNAHPGARVWRGAVTRSTSRRRAPRRRSWTPATSAP